MRTPMTKNPGNGQCHSPALPGASQISGSPTFCDRCKSTSATCRPRAADFPPHPEHHPRLLPRPFARSLAEVGSPENCPVGLPHLYPGSPAPEARSPLFHATAPSSSARVQPNLSPVQIDKPWTGVQSGSGKKFLRMRPRKRPRLRHQSPVGRTHNNGDIGDPVPSGRWLPTAAHLPDWPSGGKRSDDRSRGQPTYRWRRPARPAHLQAGIVAPNHRAESCPPAVPARDALPGMPALRGFPGQCWFHTDAGFAPANLFCAANTTAFGELPLSPIHGRSSRFATYWGGFTIPSRTTSQLEFQLMLPSVSDLSSLQTPCVQGG